MRDFFAAAPGSLRDHLNLEEVTRVVMTAIAAGGGIFTLLGAIALNVALIFPSPNDAALAAVVLTLVLESRRRLMHGEERGPTSVLRNGRASRHR